MKDNAEKLKLDDVCLTCGYTYDDENCKSTRGKLERCR